MGGPSTFSPTPPCRFAALVLDVCVRPRLPLWTFGLSARSVAAVLSAALLTRQLDFFQNPTISSMAELAPAQAAAATLQAALHARPIAPLWAPSTTRPHTCTDAAALVATHVQVALCPSTEAGEDRPGEGTWARSPRPPGEPFCGTAADAPTLIQPTWLPLLHFAAFSGDVQLLERLLWPLLALAQQGWGMLELHGMPLLLRAAQGGSAATVRAVLRAMPWPPSGWPNWQQEQQPEEQSGREQTLLGGGYSHLLTRDLVGDALVEAAASGSVAAGAGAAGGGGEPRPLQQAAGRAGRQGDPHLHAADGSSGGRQCRGCDGAAGGGGAA